MNSCSIGFWGNSPTRPASYIKEIIEGLGHHVVDGCKVKNNHYQNNLGMIVAYFCGNEYSDVNLDGLLDDYIDKPKLAIFDNSEVSRDMEFVNQFNDFVIWPCDINELSRRIAKVLEEHQNDDVNNNSKSFVEMNLVGSSEIFSEAVSSLEKISQYDAPVLIEGETGTGKELAARAIHYQSSRRHFPFIPVNCGAIPDSLVENELFGHIKGAYTDAKSSQVGLVAQAEGGTLFLDELDSLSEKSQVVLLRFLQDFTYKRIGDKEPKQANIRLLAACNCDLLSKAEQGEFRLDLFYRINILYVKMPALRHRKGDVRILCEHFQNRFQKQYNLYERRISEDVLKKYESLSWLGNVRQLENEVHREFLMSDNMRNVEYDKNNKELNMPTVRELDENIYKMPLGEAKKKVIEEFERQYLIRVIAETNGNVTQASIRAGKERRALGKMLKKYRISRYSNIEQ